MSADLLVFLAAVTNTITTEVARESEGVIILGSCGPRLGENITVRLREESGDHL